jgi:hypothetical protein
VKGGSFFELIFFRANEWASSGLGFVFRIIFFRVNEWTYGWRLKNGRFKVIKILRCDGDEYCRRIGSILI